MITHLEIDENLLKQALALSDSLTENQLISEALREYIQRRQQQKVLDLFGTIDYEEDYDYKQQRQVR
jgi:Bacterial antitoxin of type II TA system, VapB